MTDMLDVKLFVMALEREGNVFGWLPAHETWGEVELQAGRNVFSSVAMSARTVSVKLRRQALNLDNCLLWGDRYIYITEIGNTEVRHYLSVTAVLLDPVICSVTRESYGLDSLNRRVLIGSETTLFPAWLTEKYVGRQQADPQVVVDIMYVLIVPKAVSLNIGEIVTISDKHFAVWLAHTLDSNKNEYEISRKEEP